MNKVSYILLALILSSCARFNLENMAMVKTQNTFLGYLAVAYKNLSSQSLEKGNFEDAEHYASKSMLATQGFEPVVDLPNKTYIDKNTLVVLEKARTQVGDVIKNRVIKIAPREAASVVAMYDCWVEAEEHGGDASIGSCKNLFLQALDNLYAVHKIAPEQIATKEITYAKSGNLVYFKSGSSEVDSDGKATLDSINHSGLINLNGHADKNGSDAANMDLSLKRAKAVKQIMVANGLLPENISIFYFGELGANQNRIMEDKYRRVVEIILQN
jgi:outer membrane protein OmpA-like peptidoglycan-associated protein